MTKPKTNSRATSMGEFSLKFDHILVVTYGRSGSTLLQGILNSIDGVLLRGENDNIFRDLFMFWRHGNDIKKRFGNAATPDRAWFGAGEFPSSAIIKALQKVARRMLLGGEVDDERVRCLGFKEIRYAELGGDLEVYLDFLQQLFPNLAIIVNTRTHDRVAESAWWRSRSQTEVKRELAALERRLIKYIEDLPNSYVIAYEDVLRNGQAVRSLFQFLGAPYNQSRIDEVLAVRHSYQPKNLEEQSKKEIINAVRLLEQQGRSAEALQKAWIGATRWPEDLAIALLASRHLTAWDHWESAHLVLNKLPADSQTLPAVQCQRAAIELTRQEPLRALDIIDSALEQAPNELPLQRMRFNILLDLGQFSDAESQLLRISIAHWSVDTITGQITLLRKQNRDQDALTLIIDWLRKEPNSEKASIAYCQERLNHIQRGLQPISQWDDKADEILGDLLLAKPHSPAIQILALRLAIFKEDANAVAHRLGTLPKEWQHRPILNAHVWLAAHQGLPIEQIRSLWSNAAANQFIPQIRRPIDGELVHAGGDTTLPSPDEIVLFTVVRNEIQRLPWFLNYYRKLGVEKFVFVDNASTDGTLDILKAQSDAIIFSTSESYARGRSGVVWLNHLIETLGSQSWNLYVDVDEALVFPKCESRGLRHLVDYLDKTDDESVSGFMIDMFSSSPEADMLGAGEEVDFIKDYPMFNSNYTRVAKPQCPYFAMYGGIRGDLGLTPELTKTPLMRGGRGIKLLSSSHSISPARVSPVRCALLHYKFVGDYQRTFRKDVAENHRIPACRNRHLGYLAALNRLGEPTHRFLNESTLRFESSETLLAQGLIGAPSDFLA